MALSPPSNSLLHTHPHTNTRTRQHDSNECGRFLHAYISTLSLFSPFLSHSQTHLQKTLCGKTFFFFLTTVQFLEVAS